MMIATEDIELKISLLTNAIYYQLLRTISSERLISVSDFKADFNKKHNHEGNIKQFYYAVPYYILDKIKDLVPEQAGILVAVYENEHWQLKRYKKAVDNKSATPIDEEKLNKIFRIGYLKYWFYRKREE